MSLPPFSRAHLGATGPIDVRTPSMESRNSTSEEQLVLGDETRLQASHCLMGRGCQASKTRPFRLFECSAAVTALGLEILTVLNSPRT